MDIKMLRQKILDLAIRGKLVSQNPEDEPATVLLERIRAEKGQMVKDGKLKAKDIKKDTVIFRGDDNLHYEKFTDGTVKCIEDEIPFDVPEGWAWCRLGNICSMAAGKTKPSSEIKDKSFENSFPCYGGNGIRGYVDQYNHDGIYSIIGRQGALCGNINMASGKFYATEHAVVVKLFTGIDFQWNTCLLEGLNLNQYATGAAQPGLAVANILNVIIPVPPQLEQMRIGKVLQNVFDLINQIDNEKIRLTNIIYSLKSKILDLAIRGKLVSQKPDDEPASVLLERIRTKKEELIKQGKIKRDKRESIIYRDDDNSYYEKFVDGSIVNINNEIYLDLPDGWIWLRGRNCFASMESRKPEGEYFDYIDIDSVNNKSNAISNPKHILCSEAPSRASRAVFDGSVVFSLVRPYLKNIAYIDKSLARCIASTGFYVCTSNGILYSKYMFLLLISDYTIQGLNQYMKGDNSPSIRKDDIENWLFPIPPYNEQIRIVQQWRNYNAKFNKIEASLI